MHSTGISDARHCKDKAVWRWERQKQNTDVFRTSVSFWKATHRSGPHSSGEATRRFSFTRDIPTLKTPTSVKMSLLRKCVNAVPVFETQSTGYLYSPFLNGTRGLFSLSRAGLVHGPRCRSCCQSAAQEESIMCDLHLGLSCTACLKRKTESEKKRKVVGLSLPQSAVKWHKSLSSCSEAIEPREPVKLQPSHPRLIKPTAIKVRLGSFRLSMCPQCWD